MVASEPSQSQASSLKPSRPRGVPDFACDPAKVEDQVRFLARTLEMTLEPDGAATVCKAVRSGFDSHRRLYGSWLEQSSLTCRYVYGILDLSLHFFNPQPSSQEADMRSIRVIASSSLTISG
jgi:hypothetical protein